MVDACVTKVVNDKAEGSYGVVGLKSKDRSLLNAELG